MNLKRRTEEELNQHKLCEKYTYQYEQIKSGYVPDEAFTPDGKPLKMKYFGFTLTKLPIIIVVCDILLILFTYFVIYCYYSEETGGKRYYVI